MPYVHVDDRSIYFEEAGDPSAQAILALAPGGLDSQTNYWRVRATGVARGFPDPRDFLARHFRVISMDQRNAGRSGTAVTRAPTWDDFARDQLAVIDHLGIERFHIIGACIGGSFGFKLMQLTGDRIASFVVQATIGRDASNLALSEKTFWEWADALRAREPGVDRAVLEQQYHNLYDRDFVYSVDRAFVAQLRTPLLVLRGHDAPHPAAISDEIARIAPNARLEKEWDGPDNASSYERMVTEFFLTHST